MNGLTYSSNIQDDKLPQQKRVECALCDECKTKTNFRSHKAGQNEWNYRKAEHLFIADRKTKTNLRSRKAGQDEWNYLLMNVQPKQTSAAVRRVGMNGNTFG